MLNQCELFSTQHSALSMTSDPIIIALAEQVNCYRRLAKLAEAQHQHIQNSDTESLIDVLQHRQQLLDQMKDFENVIAPAKKQWNEYLGGLDGGSRARAESLLAESRVLLEKITTADRDDVLALQLRKINLGRQIQQTNAARQVNRSYVNAAYGKVESRMDVQT
jgi:hypothetical protein